MFVFIITGKRSIEEECSTPTKVFIHPKPWEDLASKYKEYTKESLIDQGFSPSELSEFRDFWFPMIKTEKEGTILTFEKYLTDKLKFKEVKFGYYLK